MVDIIAVILKPLGYNETIYLVKRDRGFQNVQVQFIYEWKIRPDVLLVVKFLGSNITKNDKSCNLGRYHHQTNAMRDRCQPRATVFKSLFYSIPFFPFVGCYKQSFPFLQLQLPTPNSRSTQTLSLSLAISLSRSRGFSRV